MKGRLGLMVAFLVAAAGALLLAPERAPGRQTAAAVFPGGPYYVIGCGFSHRSNDDPIRVPEPARQVAQPHVPREPDDGRLVDAGRPPRWADQLRRRRRRVRVLGADALRRLHAAPPPGRARLLRQAHVRADSHLPGRAADARRQPDGDERQSTTNVYWTCGRRRSPRSLATVRNCSGRPTADAPSTSRTAGTAIASTAPTTWTTWRTPCVAGARRRSRSPVPTVTLIVLYPPVSASAKPSAGRFAAHADFMNGWDAEVLGGQVAALNRSRPPDG